MSDQCDDGFFASEQQRAARAEAIVIAEGGNLNPTADGVARVRLLMTDDAGWPPMPEAQPLLAAAAAPAAPSRAAAATAAPPLPGEASAPLPPPSAMQPATSAPAPPLALNFATSAADAATAIMSDAAVAERAQALLDFTTRFRGVPTPPDIAAILARLDAAPPPTDTPEARAAVAAASAAVSAAWGLAMRAQRAAAVLA